MAPRRRNQLLLAAVGIVLGIGLYRAWPNTAVAPVATANVRGAAGAAGDRGTLTAPDVHLEALDAEWPGPGDTRRNPFEFGSSAPPAPRPTAPVGPPSSPAAPGGPSPSAGVPPIPLKFIGIIEAPEQAQKIAVLRDDRGVYRGKEGETIEGRYRILRIGGESIEMSYLDGRGRQTIRLSGS